ncbi:MAG TPA: hypothetical protein VFU81_09700, partial [Thermomicrobiales bacterium]|nr:hypothetical protein [Thermomicrobiales bacterium]
YSATAADTPAQELAEARARFFRPRRFRDPFDAERIVTYDPYDLLVVDISDPVGNRVTAGERLPDDSLDGGKPGNDYRVLQPRRLMDPNRNRIEVAFDALGLVVGTAMMGKPPPAPVEGDSLDGFAPDLTQAQIDAVYEAGDPRLPAATILADATTRVIYDLDRFQRTRAAHPNDPAQWLPAYAATVARETHAAAPPDEGGLRVQVSFAYSDGFGRVIQKKVRAEPGPVIDGGPVVDPRWVGSGWTIFNNKGNPVRQYEPFFSRLAETRHRFEFGAEVGVSPILFYDPAQRVVATLHPNHAYEKALFDPWRQASYDVNDTVSLEPQADDDLKGYFLRPDGAPRLPETDYLPSWRALRTDPAHAAEAAQRWPDARTRAAEAAAAQKAADHALTPTVVHVDALGRAFLTLADNGLDPAQPTQHLLFAARVDLDIEGNQRAVRDAVVQNGDRAGRIVMRYDYDLLGNRIHQASMEAGERWMLNDVAGKPMRAWDSRGHAVRTEYDALRRPLRLSVVGADPANPAQELLTERMVYGEQHPEEERNLRGRLFLHLDQSGAALDERCDFKGNLKLVSRRLTSGAQYRQAVDWRTVDDD